MCSPTNTQRHFLFSKSVITKGHFDLDGNVLVMCIQAH